jgi:hypothetical protein
MLNAAFSARELNPEMNSRRQIFDGRCMDRGQFQMLCFGKEPWIAENGNPR